MLAGIEEYLRTFIILSLFINLPFRNTYLTLMLIFTQSRKLAELRGLHLEHRASAPHGELLALGDDAVATVARPFSRDANTVPNRFRRLSC